jgi:hypothetical protein
MNSRFITKVEIKSNGTLDIFYKVLDKNNCVIEEHKNNYVEQPLPSFYNALNDLIKPVLDIFKIGAIFSKRIKIYKVNFKGSNEATSAIISCLFHLTDDDVWIPINTHIRKYPTDSFEDGQKGFFTYDVVDKLNIIADEAIKYLEGNRNNIQQTLFTEDNASNIEINSKEIVENVIDVPNNVVQMPTVAQ